MLDKFYFILSLPPDYGQLGTLCLGVGIGMCQDGNPHDFAQTKNRETTPSHRKMGSRNSPRKERQQDSHPVSEPWPRFLSLHLTLSIGNATVHPNSAWDHSVPPVISLSSRPTGSSIHLTNLCKHFSPGRREGPRKFLETPNLREGRSLPADCSLG